MHVHTNTVCYELRRYDDDCRLVEHPVSTHKSCSWWSNVIREMQPKKSTFKGDIMGGGEGGEGVVVVAVTAPIQRSAENKRVSLYCLHSQPHKSQVSFVFILHLSETVELIIQFAAYVTHIKHCRQITQYGNKYLLCL